MGAMDFKVNKPSCFYLVHTVFSNISLTEKVKESSGREYNTLEHISICYTNILCYIGREKDRERERKNCTRDDNLLSRR
jgi:hypothetical protein